MKGMKQQWENNEGIIFAAGKTIYNCQIKTQFDSFPNVWHHCEAAV